MGVPRELELGCVLDGDDALPCGNLARQRVVLPEPVPPTTARSCLSDTAHESRQAYHSGSEPRRTSSRSDVMRSENFLMVRIGPSRAMGGITALTRYPLLRRAFTSGLRSSRRRPSGATMRSIRMRICSSLSNRLSMGYSTPRRSKKAERHPLTMISLTVSSSSRGWSGPNPTISSMTPSITRPRRARSNSKRPCAFTIASTAGRSSARERSGSSPPTMRTISSKPTRAMASRLTALTSARRCTTA